MSQAQLSLTDSQTKQPQIGWAALTAIINNQSNDWLTYKGQYIAVPYQQLIYQFNPPDQAPSFTLTSTAPPGLISQPNPAGTCIITLTDQNQGANPGIVSGNLTIQQQQIPLGSLSAATNHLLVPPQVQMLLMLTPVAGQIGVTVTGHTSGSAYYIGTIAAASFDVCDIGSSVDTQVDIAISGATPLQVIGLPTFTPLLTKTRPVVLAAGGNGLVDIGRSYEYQNSSEGIVASDRALDTWSQDNRAVGGGGNLVLTQPSPGAGLSLIMTTLFVQNRCVAAAAGSSTAIVTVPPLLNNGVGIIAGAVPGNFGQLSKDNLRSQQAAATAITLTITDPGANFVVDGFIAGFIARSPNN